MPCYAPIIAYYSKCVGDTGKRGIVFSKTAAHSGVPLRLPCGQCIGCRLERSRQWAVRCLHEKMIWEFNYFVTLTYSDKFLPAGLTLDKRALQLFMKRLRKHYGDGIRFYGCGEYGDRTKRPHYHLILFNCKLDGLRFYKHQADGSPLFYSETLEKLWPFGFNVVGEVTFESCAYVARYITKKIFGDKAEAHYGGRQPEFTVMSRRPGIGSAWFERYGKHAYE